MLMGSNRKDDHLCCVSCCTWLSTGKSHWEAPKLVLLWVPMSTSLLQKTPCLEIEDGVQEPLEDSFPKQQSYWKVHKKHVGKLTFKPLHLNLTQRMHYQFVTYVT